MSRKSYALARGLPAAYMAEYSVVGLKVDDLDAAIAVLEESGFAVMQDDQESTIADVDIERPERLVAVVELLRSRGVDCEAADLIECVYQG